MTLGTSLGFVSVVSMGQQREGDAVKCQGDAATYAPLVVSYGTRVIGLTITVLTKKEVECDMQVFAVRENQYVQSTDGELQVAVPVEWNDDIPKTRARGKDNVDVIILADDGRFVDVQCGVITRKGKFFITAQRVYEGQVVRTRNGGPEVKWEFVPTRGIHAYPGASYSGVWSTLAEAVMKKARDGEASTAKSRVKPAEWVPCKTPSPNGGGWLAGNVDYFNLITGTGQIEGSDGVKYFVHFNNILADKKDSVPMLNPRRSVHFRPAKDGGHSRPGIKSVLSVKALE